MALEVQVSVHKSLLIGGIAAALCLCVPAYTQQPPQQQPPMNPTNPANPQNPANRPNPTMNPGQSPTYSPSTGPDSPGTTAKSDDRTFVRDAAIGGMTEVELGKLAQEKGSSEGVKKFAQRMIDDHGKANEELRKVAVSKSITVPDSMDAKHKARVDKLNKLSGPAFDKAYIKDQLKDHEQDVKEFQKEAQSGSDPAIKDFASKTLPTLQSHLDEVRNLDKPQSSADRSKQ